MTVTPNESVINSYKGAVKAFSEDLLMFAFSFASPFKQCTINANL